MGQQTIERSGSACLVFDVRDFHHAKLPEGVQARWGPFKLRQTRAAAERQQRIRTATHRIYTSLEVKRGYSCVACCAASVSLADMQQPYIHQQ